LLSKFGSDALTPKIFNGRYKAPMISRRIAADIRKKAIRERTYGAFIDGKGWDIAWDKAPLSPVTPTSNPPLIGVPRFFTMKPPKGHSRERSIVQRVERVHKAMEGMPARLDKYRLDALSRKPKKTIASLFKRVAELDRKKRGTSLGPERADPRAQKGAKKKK